MAFAVSSLLNPASAEDETKPETTSSSARASASPVQRRQSLPVSQLLSPELVHAQLPKYTPPQRPRPSFSSAAPSGTVLTSGQDGATSSQIVVDEAGNGPEGAQGVVARNEVESRSEEAGATAQTAQLNEQSPMKIKQEAEPSPLPGSPLETRHHEADSSDNHSRNLTSLKQEHLSRTQSPLRESSVVLPTIEDNAPPSSATMKKKSAPAKKKGTASAAKKPKGVTKKKKPEKKAAPKNARNGIASFSPAPSEARSFSADVDDEDEDESVADSDDDVEGSGDVYCICRKPDNGTFMIGCDGRCEDWFHGKCVGIEERDKNLMANYFCPACTSAGYGRTSWKRMCRRHGCRQPARVGKNAHKDGTTSKYCSDECGVLFFREMTARARGAEHAKKNRLKSGLTEPVATDDGLARGGLLSSGEVRTLLDRSENTSEFKAIGNGVLSPPPTPTGEKSTTFTDAETAKLQDIEAKKDAARQRHRILKERLAFVGFVKTEATRVAAARDLKIKDYCGYDPRMNWSNEEFEEWRQSPAGTAVFERQSLEQQTNGTTDEIMTDGDAPEIDESMEVCTRKKCARHAEWGKLAVDEIRFEMTDNSDQMRGLEQQNQEIRQLASLRSKHPAAELAGTVEWHTEAQNGQITPAEQPAHDHDAMQVDTVEVA